MPVDEAYSGVAGDMIVAPVRRRKVRRTRSPPFGLTDQRVPLDSAHAVAAARRIAALEARIAYLESQVTTDELTGLLNRRGFIDAFLRANAAARRGGPRGIVVLCDLDGFKELNDRYGHVHGDHMLRRMGALLRAKTRKMDAVARIGGDEFALLLISAPLASAARKSRDLGKALRSIGLEASFGAAEYVGDEDEDTVLHRADIAMYEEKRRRARTARG